jgi:hypothetical protein
LQEQIGLDDYRQTTPVTQEQPPESGTNDLDR